MFLVSLHFRILKQLLCSKKNFIRRHSELVMFQKYASLQVLLGISEGSQLPLLVKLQSERGG